MNARLTPWFVVYFALLAAVAGGMFYARSVVLQAAASGRAQADWDATKAKLEEQAGRRPKSESSPATQLLGPYFGVCLTIALLLSGVLFGVILLMLRGAVYGSQTPARSPEELGPDS